MSTFDLLALHLSQMAGANCSVATAFFVHNWQTRCLMGVEFPPGFFNGFIHAAAGGRRTHNLLNRDFRGPPVLGCHTMTHVAFGYDAYQATALFAFHDGRAPASRLEHCQCGML
jgi:hypothetical protein